MEHVVLVAMTIESDKDFEGAQREAMPFLVNLLNSKNPDSPIIEWWIAEDERYDHSDLESAVFIPAGIDQREARELLEFYKAANDVAE